MNEEIEQREYKSDARVDASLAYLADQIIAAPDQKLLDLISNGWEDFYSEIFGRKFVEGFDSLETADRHHSEAIEWHWEARLALLNGGRPPDDYFAYFPTWARGGGKTTLMRAMLRTDALMSFAHGKGGYALIPGGTKGKVRGTALSVEKSLHEPQIQKWCPALARVARNVYGHSRGWTSDFITTQANYVFHFIGLDEGVAGANVDDMRVTFICPDDIDSREDSPVIAETRFKVFTTEILPTRQADTLVFWAQNLISRFSVRYRIEKQHARVLTYRKPTEAVPAVRHPVFEQRTVNGIVKDIIVAGHPTWRRWNLQRIQDEIDTMGLPAFMSELQHDVERVDKDRMIHTWQDAVHVISESEFESVYGKQKRLANGRMAMPPAWVKDWGNDWARTKTKFHANVSLWRTVSPQSSKLPGFTFYFHPTSYAPNSQAEDVAETLLSQLSDGPEYVKVETEFQTVYRPVSDKLAAKSWADLRIDELTRADALQHTRTTLGRIEFERTALAEVFPMYTEGTLKANNVLGGVNSHERDDIRKIYGAVYGLGCRGVNPKKYGGVEQINRDFKVDWNTAHPFRPNENGYSRTFVVVPDDLSQPSRTVDGMHVYPPKPFNDSLSPEALIDDDLFRFQMVSWRTRPATLTATGETIDDPEKLNDDFGNCFIAGTMVDTEFGERPIETIREGELVWTRQGLRPVLKAGMTAYDVEVVEARLSTGRTLCGTGDHPVWVEGSGWNRLQMLPTGSTLGYRCQTINANPDLKDSFGGESPFTAIQTLVKGLTESILHLISPTEVKGSAIFTSRSGRTLTDQFRKAARSIIEITTHRITISTILSASPLAATGHITPAYEIRPRKTSSNWLGCGQTTTANTTGTVVPRGGGPCLSGQSSSPQINRESTLSAALAAKHSSQLSRRLNSAPPSALRGIETELSRLDRILASIRERARTVARNSWLGPQPKNAASPPVLLGTRQLAERQNVYNLEVSDVPEFFANGVLVHNCTQMMTVAGALGQAKLTIEQEYQMLVPAAAKPNPDIPMTHARQHAMEAARYAAQLQLEEKYGEELYEMVEEEDPF